VQKGRSVRLRISETYTDEKSYRLEGEELVFDRTLGRPHNAVVLPAGWYLTGSAIPAAVSRLPDGRIRLDFVNPRPDEIAVLIKAKRRPGKNSHFRFHIPDSKEARLLSDTWNLESGMWNPGN
jgi:hypothetical protein